MLVSQQFQKLAEGLPYSKHIHSTLICPITLEVMNEDNPPMVAPNGAVYSETAVCKIAAQNNGTFKNPESGTWRDNDLPWDVVPCSYGKEVSWLQGTCAKWMR